MKAIKHYGYAVYLGFILSVLVDLSVMDWKWWVIIVPVIVLVCVREEYDK